MKNIFQLGWGCSPRYSSEDVTDVYDADDGDKKCVWSLIFVNLISCKLILLME